MFSSMRVLRGFVFWNVFLLVTPRHTEQNSCHQFKMKKENLNKRLLGYKLFERKVSVHHECAYECMFLTACESINFISSSKTCELNSEGSETVDPSDFVESKRTTFSDITDWPMSMASGCFKHKCGEKKRCFPLGNIAHKCVDITCDEPKRLKYGVVQPGSNIAESVRSYVFICPQHTSVIGDTSITCLLNGEWSPLVATCKVPTIGTRCDSTADCNETGAECVGAKCYCGRLYRYNTDINDCVKVCSGMKDTFTGYAQRGLDGRNDLGISTETTYEECLQLCIDDANCLSFEHLPAIEKCQRSSYSKEMVEDIFPEAIEIWAPAILYSRDCH